MVAPTASLPIRRNTLLLAGVLAVNSAVLQLVAAVSSLTFVLVTGFEKLLGLGPAIFLVSSALTAVPAGRLMDRLGRIPVIAGGFALGAIGCWLTALGTATGSAVAVIAGFALIGSSSGIALLVRTAAGDMYPAARRGRGISYVLFGAVFGAILGPAFFSPLFSGKELDADVLTIPWIAAGFISCIALGLAQADRRADRPGHGRRRGAGCAAQGDHQAPRRHPGAARRLREHGRDGVSHEPDRLHRRRPPPPRAEPDLSDHRRPRPGPVRARPLHRGTNRSHRQDDGTGWWSLIDGRLLRRPAIPGERSVHSRPAVRPRPRLEPLVRRRDCAARRPEQSRRARKAARLQRPRLGDARRGTGASRRRGARGDRRRGSRARRRRDRPAADRVDLQDGGGRIRTSEG